MTDQLNTTQTVGHPPACVNCVHFMHSPAMKYPECKSLQTQTFDVVFGPKNADCHFARRNNQRCGPDGALFVAMPESEPREPYSGKALAISCAASPMAVFDATCINSV